MDDIGDKTEICQTKPKQSASTKMPRFVSAWRFQAVTLKNESANLSAIGINYSKILKNSLKR